MKKITLILAMVILLVACNNQQPTPTVTHSVQVVNPTSGALVYINNASQGYPNRVFYVKTGEVFKYTDIGFDTSSPFGGVNQGLINCEVYVDGAKVFSYNGYSDVNYTYTGS
jgi:putative hemolysin